MFKIVTEFISSDVLIHSRFITKQVCIYSKSSLNRPVCEYLVLYLILIAVQRVGFLSEMSVFVVWDIVSFFTLFLTFGRIATCGPKRSNHLKLCFNIILFLRTEDEPSPVHGSLDPLT